MSPFLLTALLLALAAAVGYGIGHVVARRHATRRELAEFAAGRSAARVDVYHDTCAAQLRIANAALAQFPTSIGGRAIVRALGGTVPPLPRGRRVSIGADPYTLNPTSGSVTQPAGLSVTATNDGGEGAE